ncbi:MAG: dephospho-CoA kinase [Fidelibacterota bacterium]
MLKVGLTGGIGTGKSTASKFFTALGAFIFDADQKAKTLINTNKKVQKELINEFGTDILNIQQKIDKKKLARIAFQDENHQQRLNAVIHPYLYELIDAAFQNISSKNKYSMFIVDGALIYESGFDSHLDYVIVVTSQLKHRMERALNRGTLSREEILKRIELQWTEEEKIGLADFVIHNDRTEKDLKKNVEQLFRELV